MARKATLEQVKEVLRGRVCQRCALRRPGRPGDPIDRGKPLGCEAGCELFASLPQLTSLANQLDPMLRSYDVALGHRVSQLIASARTPDGLEARDGRSSPLNRHRRCVIESLSELVDGRPARRRRRRIPYVATPTPET
jgi:hypothetical protein